MTARKTSAPGDEYYKVRVVLPGALIHLSSATKPEPIEIDGQLLGCEAKWIDDPDKGDTAGYIHWPSVVGITWRYTGDGTPNPGLEGGKR